jgi:gas vesicle protein
VFDVLRHEEIKMTNGNGNGFTVGLLCGAAVGAALGLLFAPKPGSATRRDLAKSAQGLRRRGMKLYDKAADTAENVSDMVGDLADRGVEFVNDATEQVKEGYKSGKLG